MEKLQCKNGIFKLRHYNLEENQSDNLGQTLSGQLYFKAKRCYPGIKVSIKELIPEGENEVVSGDGYLYLHNSSLENGAEDGGYRYSGNQPDNYICFGAGSEEYNNGETDECPLTNKYRIIGLFPFDDNNNQLTSSENADKWLLKVIKAEYITATELGISLARTPTIDQTYTNLKRIEAELTNVQGFIWSNNYDDNKWDSSNLHSPLNNTQTGYLKFLYGENKEKWESKIETVNWNVGGWSYNVIPKNMYIGEMTDGGCVRDDCNTYPLKTGAGTKVEAKVGLMYAHDYGFAASKDNWGLLLHTYDNDTNRLNNWLFNGIHEWTISRNSALSFATLDIQKEGIIFHNTATYFSNGIRPTFYLGVDASIVKDGDIDGSMDKPYKVL